MINLGISDSLFIAFLPIKMAESARGGAWTLPAVYCPIYLIFHFGSIYASVLFLTALSVGRYLSVAFPIRYQMYKRPRYSCAVSLGLWILVASHVSFIFLVEAAGGGGQGGAANASVCYGNFTGAQLDLVVSLRLELCVVLFLLPLAVTTCSYLGCARALGRSQLPRRKRNKALRVAAATLFLYVACFAPYNLSHLVGYARHENVAWRHDVLLLSAANAFLDPLVFFCSSSALQRAAKVRWHGARQWTGARKERLTRFWHSAISREKGPGVDLPRPASPSP
uniref:free fatty acid receptor 3-like n=1 Tax=Pristiophorus japonicus TaxID=55135 RepID=UPI00398ED443